MVIVLEGQRADLDLFPVKSSVGVFYNSGVGAQDIALGVRDFVVVFHFRAGRQVCRNFSREIQAGVDPLGRRKTWVGVGPDPAANSTVKEPDFDNDVIPPGRYRQVYVAGEINLFTCFYNFNAATGGRQAIGW